MLKEQPDRFGAGHGRGSRGRGGLLLLLLLLFRREPEQVFDGHVRRRRSRLLTVLTVVVLVVVLVVMVLLLLVVLLRLMVVLVVPVRRLGRRTTGAIFLARGRRVPVVVVVVLGDQHGQQFRGHRFARVVAARRRVPDAAAAAAVPFQRHLVHLVAQRRPRYAVYDGRPSRTQLAALDVPERGLQLVLGVRLPSGHVTGLFGRLRSVRKNVAVSRHAQ